MKFNLLNNSKHSKEAHQSNYPYLDTRAATGKTESKLFNQSIFYTSLLYLASILSIAAWLISLVILPFGSLIQFGLGALILSVNLLIMKWAKV